MDKEDVVHIYMMEYYSAIKKNEILNTTTQVNFEDIMLSQSYTHTEKIVKIIGTESRMAVVGGGRERRMESYCLMGIELQFYKRKSVLEMDGGDENNSIYNKLHTKNTIPRNKFNQGDERRAH